MSPTRKTCYTKTNLGLLPPSLKMAESEWISVGQSYTIEQQRRTTRPTRSMHYKNFFRFAAAYFEHGGNRLGQPRILEIRRATSWAGLYNGNNTTIRCHTISSGEAGPVVFDRMPTWWLMKRWFSRAVSSMSDTVFG